MITKEQFQAYEKVRKSGKTNMFDTGMVAKLSKFILNREQVMEIIKNYNEIKEQYK